MPVKKDLLSITILQLEKVYGELLEDHRTSSFYIMQTKGNLIFVFLIKTVCEEFLTSALEDAYPKPKLKGKVKPWISGTTFNAIVERNQLVKHTRKLYRRFFINKKNSFNET